MALSSIRARALGASASVNICRLSQQRLAPLPLPFVVSRRLLSHTSVSLADAPYMRPSMPPDAPDPRAGQGAQTDQTHGKLSAGLTDEYLLSKLAHPEYAGDSSLARGLKRAQEASMPEIAVTPLQGQFLSVLAKSIRAERILEIGTLGGYSTTFLAKALPSHGQLDTLEFSPQHAQVAQQNMLDTDLYPFPRVHVGRALDILRDPAGPFAVPPGTEEGAAEPGYDLCFVDANKEEYFEYWMECLRLTRKGGVIVLDNAVRGGRIVLEENDRPEIDVTGLRKVYDWVEKDKGKTVVMSAIQTVGAKFWDGFAIAYKL